MIPLTVNKIASSGFFSPLYTSFPLYRSPLNTSFTVCISLLHTHFNLIFLNCSQSTSKVQPLPQRPLETEFCVGCRSRRWTSFHNETRFLLPAGHHTEEQKRRRIWRTKNPPHHRHPFKAHQSNLSTTYLKISQMLLSGTHINFIQYQGCKAANSLVEVDN